MADSKISALPVQSAITDDDIFPIVNDPAGTPVTQSVTAAILAKYAGAYRCTSDPTGSDGMLILRTDIDTVKYHDGTGWIVVFEPDQPFFPTITATVTNPTGWTMTGSYQRHMGRCTGWAKYAFGAGTAASGTLRFGLPFNANYTIMPCGVGVVNDDAVAAHQRQAIIGAAASYMQLHDSAGTAVTGISPITPSTNDYYAIWFDYQMSSLYN